MWQSLDSVKYLVRPLELLNGVFIVVLFLLLFDYSTQSLDDSFNDYTTLMARETPYITLCC